MILHLGIPNPVTALRPEVAYIGWVAAQTYRYIVINLISPAININQMIARKDPISQELDILPGSFGVTRPADRFQIRIDNRARRENRIR
jgi:hypothetical protein